MFKFIARIPTAIKVVVSLAAMGLSFGIGAVFTPQAVEIIGQILPIVPFMPQ